MWTPPSRYIHTIITNAYNFIHNFIHENLAARVYIQTLQSQNSLEPVRQKHRYVSNYFFWFWYWIFSTIKWLTWDHQWIQNENALQWIINKEFDHRPTVFEAISSTKMINVIDWLKFYTILHKLRREEEGILQFSFIKNKIRFYLSLTFV